MPKIPSNRATANVIPGCFIASPNCWPGMGRPAIWTEQQEVEREAWIWTENTCNFHKMIGVAWPAKLRNAVEQTAHVSEQTHGDGVLANEARQAASSIHDGELCAVLNICAGFLGVVAVMKPWWWWWWGDRCRILLRLWHESRSTVMESNLQEVAICVAERTQCVARGVISWKIQLTAGQILEIAVNRGDPEVRGAGVEHHSEVLWRGANADLSKILGLGRQGRLTLGNGEIKHFMWEKGCQISS